MGVGGMPLGEHVHLFNQSLTPIVYICPLCLDSAPGMDPEGRRLGRKSETVMYYIQAVILIEKKNPFYFLSFIIL